MKNLTKRNLTILAIAGIVVIAIIAVAAFRQVGGGQLFGATTNIVILPSSPSVFVGAAVQLSTSPSVSCNWSVADGTKAKITSTTKGTTVTVAGVAQGTTTVNAICGTTTISTTLKVYAIVSSPTPTATHTRTPTNTPTPTPTRTRTPTPLPQGINPSNPSIVLNGSVQFSMNPAETCTWSVGNTAIATISGSNTGSSVTVFGVWPYNTSVTATCPSGTSSTNLTITEPQHYQGYVVHISPEHGTVHVGGYILYLGYGMDCSWWSSNTNVATIERYSNSDSAHAYGHAAGTATLTGSCSLGTYSANLLVVP